jgi:hypothetical protein
MLHLKFSGYYNLNGNHEAVPRSTEAETSLFVFRHHRLPEALPFPFMTRDLYCNFRGRTGTDKGNLRAFVIRSNEFF